MTRGRPRRPWDRTPPEQREYFDLLGEGLVAQLAAPSAPDAGSRGDAPASGAWLHVGPDGIVRAFTGKAEVGQGTRTALGLLVAEELRLPLERIELEMADTDLCPWDMGTFGSRSMPDAGPALRAAAAGAREALLDLAAAARSLPRDRLEAREGEVRLRGATSGTPYAELVRGLREVRTIDRKIGLTPPSAWERAGHPVADPRGADVVTGRRAYVSDLRPPGLQYGAVLHPPRYGARLRHAEPGPEPLPAGTRLVVEPPFVGAVGPSPRLARAALAQVRADWILPEPNDVDVEAYLRSHPRTEESWDRVEDRAGDPDHALASATVTVRATYRTAYVAHVPLETRAAVAEWEGRRLTVWVGTQTPFRARDHVAEALAMSVDDVRVIVPFTGAGFGGKHGGDVATAAARLARAVGCPVALQYSREEEFRFGYFRPMAIIDIAAGAEKDGRLSAWTFHNTNAGAAALRTPYRVAHRRIDNELSESPLPQGAYRSLAANTNNFARESVMDELAARLGIDPLEFRRKNLEDERLRAVLDRAADRSGWGGWVPRAGWGHGLALGFEKSGRVATVAEVEVRGERDLRVRRLVTAFEAGAIVHPRNLLSQVEGAAVQAIGGALFEEIRTRAGRVLNPRLSQYRVPRFSDLPEIEVVLLDRPDLPPAGGGETPMIATAPAIANAIFDATGRRVRHLPLLGKEPTAPTDRPSTENLTPAAG